MDHLDYMTWTELILTHLYSSLHKMLQCFGKWIKTIVISHVQHMDATHALHFILFNKACTITDSDWIIFPHSIESKDRVYAVDHTACWGIVILAYINTIDFILLNTYNGNLWYCME